MRIARPWLFLFFLMGPTIGLFAFPSKPTTGKRPASRPSIEPGSGRKTPNIVVIVADDLGYADLGAQGATDIKTPNLDSIAANGVRFTNGYVTAPVCSPSRAGFLTGCHQQRFGYEFNPGRNEGLTASATLLPERLRENGYKTALVGKWHLGNQADMRPQRRGFDEFFGFLAGQRVYLGNETMNPIYRGNQVVTESAYLTDAFSREAVDFIRRNRANPFFLAVTYNAPHTPMQATSDYLARFPDIQNQNRRTFAAMMAAMDDGVGEILATLRESNLEENTLIVFFSDNGGPTRQNSSRNTPLRGSKDSLFEGGIRVPFLMQWKGTLPAGETRDAIVTTLDLVPTFLAAATGETPTDQSFDGFNLLPWLTGVAADAPRDRMFWRYGTNEAAVRVGDWKLLFLDGDKLLFNLAADVGEETNLAATNPEKLAELQATFDAWNQDLPPVPTPRVVNRTATLVKR